MITEAQPQKWRTLLGWCGLALGVALVVSCGGGGGVVGSGGTGAPYGVALGSVIVDGVSYDDRAAHVVTETEPDHDVVSDVKLGDRISLAYQSAGVAQVVRVEPTLAGAVANVASASRFSMLGQEVLVNTSAATGPVTQFGGGYGRPGDVQAGDFVEVHGVVVAQAASYIIQATRIDKLAAAPTYLRVTGVLSNLDPGATPTFMLGALAVDAQGAALRPTGVALANAQTVTLLALPVTLTMPNAGAWQVKAAQVRIAGVRDNGLDDYVSGSVSHLDKQARTFTLGSLNVRYAGASITPAATSLENGRYVQVRGSAAADGTMVASGVMIRDGESEVESELKGNITGFVAGATSFSVRGVQVDASSATLVGCPGTGLANDLFVDIQGALSASGVVAATVHCEGEPPNATIEREGVASAVDPPNRRFSLTPEGKSPIVVTWTESTFFGGVAPSSLAGKKVHVEGSFVDGVLAATQIKRED